MKLAFIVRIDWVVVEVVVGVLTLDFHLVVDLDSPKSLEWFSGDKSILEFVFDTLYFKKRQNYEASKQAFESQFTGNRNRLKAIETDES